jgi:outer membrane receptor protein involved in Fe transport
LATVLAALLIATPGADAQTSTPASISGVVTTQHTTPLAGASVKIVDATGLIVFEAVTDESGRFHAPNLIAGSYRVIVALEGFDTTTALAAAPLNETALAIDLPIAKLSDSIDVLGAATAVSKGDTLAASEAIASRERDEFVPGGGFQGAVRMLANVVTLPNGISIKGGRPTQAGVQLGATTLVDPASGLARVALPDDAIESVTVLPNPYAVEYGRFSSGLALIDSRRGRDRWVFRANRFGPGFRQRNDSTLGFRLENYNPRLEVGGPLVKDRVFLEQSAQGRYSIGDVPSRPENDQPVTKAFSTFTRLDAALAPRHNATATIGWFPGAAKYATVGTFIPPEASVDLHVGARQLSVIERAAWTDRTVSETSVQFFHSTTEVDPQGSAVMELQPDTALGNFFNQQRRETSSLQVVHILTGHRDVYGSHLFKIGVDLLHTEYDSTSASRPILIERPDGTVVRRLDFSGPTVQTASATDAAFFAQDRWQWHPRWYFEGGARVDRDGVLARVNVSPRIGTAVLLTSTGSVILRGGWGLFVERTPSVAGAFTSFESILDSRFAVDGVAPSVSRVVHTVAPALETPVSRTWDVGLDYRVNERWLFHTGFLNRDGRHELIVTPLSSPGVERQLSSDGRSRYRDVELRAQYTRGTAAEIDVTYTHSVSEGDLNGLTDYYDSVLAPIVGDNAYARLTTDIPDRVLIRGRVSPAPKWLLLGIFEWHTGTPYSVVNETLDFVSRNTLRFPAYSRVELDLERRFKVLKFRPWVGVRWTNVLNTFLPYDVQNNTASPFFGAFYNPEPRRIRFQVRFER